MGARVAETRPIPDELDQIAATLAGLADSGNADLIITTIARNRGTRPAPRDVTPEATGA